MRPGVMGFLYSKTHFKTAASASRFPTILCQSLRLNVLTLVVC
jgi:hypothetical protein